MTTPLRILLLRDLRLGVPVRTPRGPLRSAKHSETAQARDALADSLRTATHRAWQTVQELCIEREVDLLLLAGGSFIEEDKSLAARAALHEGLWTLHEAETTVVAIPGRTDSVSAWQAVPDRPPSTIILPTALPHRRRIETAKGRVVLIGPAGTTESAPGSETDAELTLGFVAPGEDRPDGDTSDILYAVTVPLPTRSRLDESAESKPSSIIAPGRPQPVKQSKAGAGVVLFQEIRERQPSTTKWLPTGRIRHVTLTLPIESQADVDQLAEAMWERIEGAEPHATERDWIVNWEFESATDTDAASTHDWLVDPTRQAEVAAKLDALLDRNRLTLWHHFDLPADPIPAAVTEESELAHLWNGVLERLHDPRLVRRVLSDPEFLAEAEATDNPAAATSWLPDPAEYLNLPAHARRIASGWFEASTQTQPLKESA